MAEIVRELGPEEPDAFFSLAEEAADSTLESLTEFFGAALLPLRHAVPAGLVAVTPEVFVQVERLGEGWLFTTTAEIGAGVDPQAVRAAIERVRAGRER